MKDVISQIKPCRVLVIGDFLLDTYTIGQVKRISPEAPVAVMHVQKEEYRAGGAGNVALNLISLGAEVLAVGRIGSCFGSRKLLDSLKENGVCLDGLMKQEDYLIPVKNRIIAENQQIVRVDHENIVMLSHDLQQQMIASFPRLLEHIDVVAISDYGKGLFTKPLLNALIGIARAKNIPVIADPKGTDFTRYEKVSLLKPNFSEAYAAANLGPDASLEDVAITILKMAKAEMLMITRSEKGISLFKKDGTHQAFPVKAREVKDVTGAGDTVLAMLSVCLGSGLPAEESIKLCNVAAGLSVERFGCARISLSEVARRYLEEDVSGKVFDQEHFFVLKQALQGRFYRILKLSAKEGMTSSVFKAIRGCSKNEDEDLVVFVSDGASDEEFCHLLASLCEVDFILKDQALLDALTGQLPPAEMHDLCKSDPAKWLLKARATV